LLLPGCVPVILQSPEVSRDAVVPDTVQIVGVVDAKLADSPELAVAERVILVNATCVPVIAGNVMVCAGNVTAKVSDMVGAARYVVLPACLAWMAQLPPAIIVAVVPETVQIADVVESKLTVRPELAVAVNVSTAPGCWLGMAPKEMVWLAWWTSKLSETGDAAA
jgi:hypothetical protein